MYVHIDPWVFVLEFVPCQSFNPIDKCKLYNMYTKCIFINNIILQFYTYSPFDDDMLMGKTGQLLGTGNR